MDELKCRKRVLRRLGYCTPAGVIEVKGRVACELSRSADMRRWREGGGRCRLLLSSCCLYVVDTAVLSISDGISEAGWTRCGQIFVVYIFPLFESLP